MNTVEPKKEGLTNNEVIIAQKFYNQAANIAFMQQNYEDAKKAAQEGIDMYSKIDFEKEEPETKMTSGNTHRDLHNIMVRARSRLEKRPAT